MEDDIIPNFFNNKMHVNFTFNKFCYKKLSVADKGRKSTVNYRNNWLKNVRYAYVSFVFTTLKNHLHALQVFIYLHLFVYYIFSLLWMFSTRIHIQYWVWCFFMVKWSLFLGMFFCLSTGLRIRIRFSKKKKWIQIRSRIRYFLLGSDSEFISRDLDPDPNRTLGSGFNICNHQTYFQCSKMNQQHVVRQPKI